MDPSGQGPPMGHHNIRQGVAVQYAQNQQNAPQNMMRPQVQQYLNRPSPSYQGQTTQQGSSQFQRTHIPYQQQMPGHPQMSVGSPLQMGVTHKSQPSQNIQQPPRINQHANPPQFTTLNQGSPINPQQMNQQITGSPYQMIHGSPAMVPRYNSPQMTASHQQMQSQMQQPHQQMPPQQMQQPMQLPLQQMPQQQIPQTHHQLQSHSMQHQHYQQQHLQSQQMQQMHHQNQVPQHQRYQQMKQQSQNVQQPTHQQFAAQKQMQPQQQYQMQQPSPNQAFHHVPNSSQYPQQISSQQTQLPTSVATLPQPQREAVAPHQHNLIVPPPNQLHTQLENVTQSVPASVKKPLPAQQHPAQTSKVSRTVLPHPVVARLRLSDPRKNLLMVPKNSVLRTDKGDKQQENMQRTAIPKKVRWAPNLRVRRTPRVIRKAFKSRLLGPVSPPIMLSGEEAQIARQLIKPLYHGELVMRNRKRKGLPPIRARLIGGKIIKPYSKISSTMLTARRRKLSRKIIRRMAMERSFTLGRQIECGEAESNKDCDINDDLLSQQGSTYDLPKPAYNQPSEVKGIIKQSSARTLAKRPVKSHSFYKKKEIVPFRRTFFHLPIKTKPIKNAMKQSKDVPKPLLSEEEKNEKAEIMKTLNNIPWRTLPKKSDKSILPRIWHPPIILNKGWIVLHKTHRLCQPVPVWHAPLIWPPKTLRPKSRKVFKIDGPVIFNSSKDESNVSPDERKTTIQFAVPMISRIILPNQETDISKTVFDPNIKPVKSSVKPLNDQTLMEVDAKENASFTTNDSIKHKRKRDTSPPLVKHKYIRPSFRIPSLQIPPPPTSEPTERKPEVNLTDNPFYNRDKPMTYLSEQKTVFLSAEYRVAQLRETQPRNMWELNNQKMIDLMKTKGAGIDSTIREDAGKALKILEEKASKAMGKHSEIRNKLLQFCVNYGYEHAYEADDNFFYLKVGDFTMQLEIQNYFVKNAWYFWNNIEPFHAPTIAALFRKERWNVVHRAINRMRVIIPTSLTSEEKDLLLRALSCMERDLQRYHEKVHWRSHLFALNDIIMRTDINPFSIILPRSPVEVMHDDARNIPIIDKFEKCRNLVTLQIQISPLERHKFCIQSSLTPQLKWASPDTYKVGARFVMKLAHPMPIRYGAIKQLESIVSGIISQENYINAYKNLSQKLHKKDVLLNLSDYSKNFFMYFDFDHFDLEAKNDTLVTGFYIDKAAQLISAMYIIKREYILNKLCEGTCEKNIHSTEYRYTGSKATKTAINIRLADVCDGHLNLYFQYRCYLVEIKIIITPGGNVTLAGLKIVHHGHNVSPTFHTAAMYQALIYQYRSNPIILNEFQTTFLTDVIHKTWHIPHLVDETIKCLKNRCVNDKHCEPHEFNPTHYVDMNYKIKKEARKNATRQSKNSKVLKSIYKKKRKSRRSCKPKMETEEHEEDKEDPSEDQSTPTAGSKNGQRRSSGKGGNHATHASTQAINEKKKNHKKSRNSKQQYFTLVKQYFKGNINKVLKRFKMSKIKRRWLKGSRMLNTVKSRKYHRSYKILRQANVLNRFYVRKLRSKFSFQRWGRTKFDTKISKFPKRTTRQSFKKRNGLSSKNFKKIEHGTAWDKFMKEVNEDINPPPASPHTILTWPMLADQRVTLRYSNVDLKHKDDPQNDEAGRIEEMDEYFNLSDCEEAQQMCSYSTIQRKIVPALSRKSHNKVVTIDKTIGNLKPQFRKYLIKFKLDKAFQNGKKPKSPKKGGAVEIEDVNIKWGEEWKQEDFSRICNYEKEAHRIKLAKTKMDCLARPTAMRFISMLNREKPNSHGLFPCKILRHAAICLRDGPYRAPRRRRSLPKALIVRYKRKFARNYARRQRRLRWLKKRKQLQEAAEKLQQEQLTNGQPARAELRSKSVPRLKSLIRRKKLNLPPPSPPPPLTPSQIENHKRLILYFDQPTPPIDNEVFVEELRSRLMAIWIYFKPFIRTARAFERMLELYGPEAIYSQLQSHRKNLITESNFSKERQNSELNKRQNQAQTQYQRLSAPLAQSRPMSGQVLTKQMPTSAYLQQHPQSSNMMGNMPPPVYDAQSQFNYNPQDLFGDSSSSSAVSTPTSAGPLQSPFTPTGKRRGRGKRANTGTRTPSDQQFMMNSEIPKIFEAKRGRPRKSMLMTPTSYSTLDSPSQESPLSHSQIIQTQYSQQSLHTSPYMTNPSNQQLNYNTMQQSMPMYSNPMNTMTTPRPAALQPSPLATQSLSTPQKIMQQQIPYQRPVSQSHQDYAYESTSDEETDPPPPRTQPREPIKLKVDMTKVTVKPIESKVAESLSETVISESQKPWEPISTKQLSIEKEDEVKEIEKEKVKVLEQLKETNKEKDAEKEKNKEKEREKEKEKQKIKDKEQRIKEKERKRSEIAKDAAVKPQKFDKKEKEYPKSKNKESEKVEGVVKPKLKKIEGETESSDILPPPAKKMKTKLKSPEPVITRGEKEKKDSKKAEKRERSKDKEREKQLAEYEEERARKKLKAELRAERERRETVKQKKEEKLEKSKNEKNLKNEAELEAEKRREKKESKDKKKIEKLEKMDKEKQPKKREAIDKLKGAKKDIIDKEKVAPSSSLAPASALANLKKRRRSAMLPSDDDTSRESAPTSASQTSRPIKLSKPTPPERPKRTPEQLAQIKKAKALELAKLERDKRRLGITPDIEPFAKKLKETEKGTPKKVHMAQFFPEPGVLVEIPINLVQAVYNLKLKLTETKQDASGLKAVEHAKKQCLEHASRQHPETINILDNIKKLSQVLEIAHAKQKQSELAATSITAMSAAASAGVTKEEAEKLAAEKEAKLKTTQMRIEQLKAQREKEKKEKMKANEAIRNPNIGKSPLDSSEALSRMLEPKHVEAKKDQEKKNKDEDDDKGPRTAASRAAMAAAEEDATLKAIGVPSLGEALKTFKIPKVNEATTPTEEPVPVEKEKEPSIDREKEREKRDRERDRDREQREKDKDSDRYRGRDRVSSRERDRDRSYDGFHGRRYSGEYSDRKYEGDRRFSGGEGRYHERYDDYPSNRGFHQDRRGGGYQHRKHPRSPRGDSYERRGGGHYPPPNNRGSRGGTFRGRGGGSYRDSPREQWKGSTSTSSSANPHDEFYEGLPPKQQQLNREALDDTDYPKGEPQSRFRHGSYDPSTIPLPPSTFPNPPARKVLLPNRIGDSIRPSGWNQLAYFNQPPPPPGGTSTTLTSLSTAPSGTNKSPFLAHTITQSVSSMDRHASEAPKRLARPRDSRDSPPEVGLQIDESD